MIDKIPPHSNEAEQSFLGALLLDKDAIIKVATRCSGRFLPRYPPPNYEACSTFSKNANPLTCCRSPPGSMTANKLETHRRPRLPHHPLQLGSDRGNIAHYADIIVKKATLRKSSPPRPK